MARPAFGGKRQLYSLVMPTAVQLWSPLCSACRDPLTAALAAKRSRMAVAELVLGAAAAAAMRRATRALTAAAMRRRMWHRRPRRKRGDQAA
jgi:hypothetical protein